jgi:hypothetical protein
MQLSLMSTDPEHVTSHALNGSILKEKGGHLSPCNFHRVLAKDMNFEPNVGHCTTVNENVNVGTI